MQPHQKDSSMTQSMEKNMDCGLRIADLDSIQNPKSKIQNRPAFTVVELLVVIGIIVLLLSILIPAVSKIREKAWAASTQSFLNRLSQAIEAYNSDFRAYPGPLKNDEIYNANFTTINPFGSNVAIDTTASPQYATTDPNFWTHITMSENLVLGLLGGLRVTQPPAAVQLLYDPRLVGNGPNSLNTTGPIKHTNAYFDGLTNLSWRTEAGAKTGQFKDDSGVAANDTLIPCFVDSYPSAMPILYLRARKGAHASALPLDEGNNTIVTYTDDNSKPRPTMSQYDLHQIIGYTGSSIGGGKKPELPTGWGTVPVHGLSATTTDKVNLIATIQNPPPSGLTYKYPFDAYPYFRNASLSSPSESDATNYPNFSYPRNDVPQMKDGFILISAGSDRIYGTRDDITSFGSVGK